MNDSILKQTSKRIRAWMLDIVEGKLPMWLSAIVFFILPFLAFYMLESFTQDPSLMKPAIQFTNYIVYLALQCFFLALLKTQKRAGISLLLFAYLVGMANYLVISFRGTPIMPWDYKSGGTALSVLGTYSFPWSKNVFIASGLLIAGLVLTWKTAIQINLRALRLISIAGASAILIGVFSLIHYPLYANGIKLDNTLFTPNYMYRHNGFSVAFIRNVAYLQVPEPEGYSIEKVNDIMDEYLASLPESLQNSGIFKRYENGIWLSLKQPSDYPNGLRFETDGTFSSSVEVTPTHLDAYAQTGFKRGIAAEPNVIVIMSEGFSELSVLADFNTNQEYMPFLNGLSENTIKGYLHASIIGGNTATSEFEFLTSDSMAFLPAGSVAYQQFVTGPMPTLNSMLKEQGYHAVAMHPYHASGWERDVIYPYMGFDVIKFLPDFKHQQRIRNYVSDEALFNEILYELDRAPEDTPSFIFTVSMQNHGGYSKRYDDFPVSMEILNDGNYPWVEHYLELIKETDRALEQFLNELKAKDEETIVLFFGDHQPNNSTVSALEGMDSYNVDPTARYIVPYFIWANFDIDSQVGQTTSLNYLAGDLLDAAGIQTSPYLQFLNDLQEEIPVINAEYFILKDGSTYFFDEEMPDDPKILELLNQYEILQYNHLIDVENRVGEIFSAVPAQ